MTYPRRYMGAVLFNIFINDRWDKLHLFPSSSYTKLGEVVGPPGGCAVVQMNLNRLVKWAERNLVKYSNGKC